MLGNTGNSLQTLDRAILTKRPPLWSRVQRLNPSTLRRSYSPICWDGKPTANKNATVEHSNVDNPLTRLNFGSLLGNTGNGLQIKKAYPDQAGCGIVVRMKELLYAYCAGYLDGDGSMYIIRAKQSRGEANYYYRPTLSARSNVQSPITRLVETLGGFQREKSDKYGRYFSYEANYKAAKAAITLVAPYMVGKSDRADLMFRFFDNVSRSTEHWVPAELLKERDSILEDLSRLNHSGCLNSKTEIDNPDARSAYLAGYLDAEGYLTIDTIQGSRGRIRIVIQSTDEAILRWTGLNFGGYVVSLNRLTKKGKKVFMWLAEAGIAFRIINLTMPWLLVKREQAEILKRYQDNVRFWVKQLGSVNQFNLPESAKVERKELLEKLSKLNSYHKPAGAETKSRQPEMASDSPALEDGKLQEPS